MKSSRVQDITFEINNAMHEGQYYTNGSTLYVFYGPSRKAMQISGEELGSKALQLLAELAREAADLKAK